LVSHGDLNLAPHGDISPHESVCNQVEVPTKIENTHTHTHRETGAHIVFISVESSGKPHNGTPISKTERKQCPEQPL